MSEESDWVTVAVKLGISVIALLKFVVPEPASTMTGIIILAGVWGIDWSPDDGGA